MKEFEFFVILCGDVLLEVLHFGNRRQLIKLERIGQRIHHIIEYYLVERPFLRLNFNIEPWSCFLFIEILKQFYFFSCFGLLCELSGCQTNVLLLEDLMDFPPRFLRFNEIKLIYSGVQSIDAKCKMFVDRFTTLKSALSGARFVYFRAVVDQNDSGEFKDHAKLLEHLSNMLLPFCDFALGYEFSVDFYTEKDLASDVISTILQMKQVQRCSEVKIALYRTDPVELPIEDILTWLVQNSDRKNQNVRFLRIIVGAIKNAQKISKCLKEVHFDFRQIIY